MRPNQIDKQRLDVLEDILEIQYEKLGEFQKEIPINASTNQKFELKQRIKREILPEILKYEVEYGQILAAGIQEAFVVSDVEAEKAIVQVVQAVEHIALFCHSPKKLTISKFCNCCVESDCSVIS